MHNYCITLLYDCFITLSNDWCITLSLHDCCIMLLLYDWCSTWLLPYIIHNDTYQSFLAFWANKTIFMPVLATYINIFHARPNTASTVLTAVGKIPLIAFDARRFVFHYDKFLLWQGLITVKTAQVTWMPVCIHGTRVFSNIDQLWKRIYRYT